MRDDEVTKPNISPYREMLAREHYRRMSAMDRILALGIGAAKRGATFNFFTEAGL